jgi:hypothetical protein
MERRRLAGTYIRDSSDSIETGDHDSLVIGWIASMPTGCRRSMAVR